jgi:hypothetical protein
LVIAVRATRRDLAHGAYDFVCAAPLAHEAMCARTQGKRHRGGVIKGGQHQNASCGKLDAQRLDQRDAIHLGRAQRIVDQQHIGQLRARRQDQVAAGLVLAQDDDVAILRQVGGHPGPHYRVVIK